ncbi:RNA polymerase [Gorgonomyces haynaldii]|nr:RNA polymerase [Gorgonomyces haynaldii]
MVQVFSGVFEVTDIDPHGKKFDLVSRIVGNSDSVDMELTLDVNTEIYPIEINDKLTFVLVTSLEGKSTDPTQKQPYKHLEKSLADDYEYVMYGKVYKYDDDGTKVSVYCSFGGLLMCLAGDYRQLQQISTGQYLYLLMRK